jgi:tetratricopeptide (TPR) repeat protein
VKCGTFLKAWASLETSEIWHGIGLVFKEAGQFEQAEHAHRQSLAIKVQQKLVAGEAASLNELGNLYGALERWEDSVKCYGQAADLQVKRQDQRYEGVARSNLAISLLKLQRYNQARCEVLRALECKKPYGDAAEPWKTWRILCDLERATGNPQAAVQAQQKACESYLAYRRAGGQNATSGAQLCALATQAITQNNTTELEGLVAEISAKDIAPPSGKLLISKLQAILRGDRDAALADDPNLDYDDAVELQLLLEALGS